MTPEPICSVTDTMTIHRWKRPAVGDECFCGSLRFAGDPDAPSVWFEQMSLDEEQFAQLGAEVTARTLEWLWSR